jgi:hypothetical protein
MTNEQAREYWCRKLERAEGYSDEHWDAEERHAHREYVDALKSAITALAICREREEAEKPKTNGDCIRNMLTDEYIVKNCFCVFFDECCDCPLCAIANCQDTQTRLEWLKQEVIEDADG